MLLQAEANTCKSPAENISPGGKFELPMNLWFTLLFHMQTTELPIPLLQHCQCALKWIIMHVFCHAMLCFRASLH